MDMRIIIIALILFITGASAMIVPALMQDIELNRDAEEYAELLVQYTFERETDAPNEQGIALTIDFQEEIGAIDTSAMRATMDANVPTNTPDTPKEQSPVSTNPSPAKNGNNGSATRAGKTGADLDALQEVNVDFVAWLKIPGTKIDYPVVLTDNVDYYLNHTFTGKESKVGTLFSLGKTDYRTPSKNIAVYGHHIQSSGQKMFQPLLSYKKQGFYENHKTIYFDTLYHSGTYQIFAVINMGKDDWDASTTVFSNDDAFLAFINRAKSQALYDTGIEVKASDYILTLITCDRSFIPVDGRLVIMAVKR